MLHFKLHFVKIPEKIVHMRPIVNMPSSVQVMASDSHLIKPVFTKMSDVVWHFYATTS